MSNGVLEVDSLRVTIGGLEILKGISFDVKAGEICALLGHNGAGKTVSLKTIMGMQKSTEGAVRLCGLEAAADMETYKRQFAYIPEEAMLFQELSVQQHFQLYALCYGLSQAVFEERVAYYAERFELEFRLDSMPGELSKGMRQKVNIISALLTDTPLLIVDEPFIGLDVQAAERLEEELRKRAARGGAVLMTSHVLERVQQLCDAYVLMKSGEVANRGAVADLQPGEVVLR